MSVDLAELQAIGTLIEGILGENNNIRKESEELFNRVKDENPDKFTLILMNLAKGSPKSQVRSFSVVMLRKHLSAFSEKNFSPLWIKLQPDTQKIVKSEIFPMLENEQAKNVKHLLADFIGEIGGTIINVDEEEAKGNQEVRQWPELLETIFTFYVKGTDPLKEAALKILTTFFTYANDEFSQYKNELFSIFKSGMEHQLGDIKLAAIQAMGSYLEICDPKDAKLFEDLLQLMLNCSIYLLSQDEQMGSDALGVLVDIAEAEPKFYKKNFKLLFQTMSKIAKVKEMEEESIRQLAIEIVTSVLERLPKLIKDDKTAINQVLEMIFTYMVEIDPKVEPEWEKPKEGFNDELENEEDNSSIKYGMHVIDRLIACIGQKRIIPNLSTIIHAMLNNAADWRYKHAALMALSQVGEYVDDLDEIDPIVRYIVTFFQDTHPKIRYAAYHCMGQICDDMQPEFQTRFHELVIPPLLQGAADPVPRVSAHCLAALTNFLEGTTKSVGVKYLDSILNVAFQYVQQGISLVKENAMSTIAAVSEATKEHYAPYFDKSIPILYNILVTHVGKEYKQLRGQTIECITLMGHAVGYVNFKKYSNQIIEALIQIQEGAFDEVDPQKSYVLSGWQRICIIMQENLVPYLERIIPSLFKVAESILKKEDKKVSENEQSTLLAMMGEPEEGKKKGEKKIEINTYEAEEVEIAVNMLSVFINELKLHFLPYIESAMRLLLPMCNYCSSEKIRKGSAKCLPGILIILKDSNEPNKDSLLVTMCNMFLATLWNAIATEYEAEVISCQIYVIKDCVDVVGKYMTQKELEDLSEKILIALRDSDQRKLENEKLKHEEDVEEEEVELLNEDNDKEEELHVALAELIGVLFKTHKELTLPLVNVLYNNVLSKVLQPGLSDKMHKFGIYLIDDMIEHLGIELIPDIWPALSEAILLFATDKSPFVRQPAVYGIGVLAEKSKDIFALMSEICIKKVVEAINAPMMPHEHPKIHGNCKDNAISALGKIIKNQAEKIPNIKETVKYWIDNLPMKYDKEEARIQHDLLIDIILHGNMEIWAGENGQNIPQIIKVLSEIVDTKLIFETTTKKISAVLKIFYNDAKLQPVFLNVIGTLPDIQKKNIQDCLNMA